MRNLRTKIEEAIGERHVHKIDNSELLDQISTIFKEELEKIPSELWFDDTGKFAKEKGYFHNEAEAVWAITGYNIHVDEVKKSKDFLINSLEEGKGQ